MAGTLTLSTLSDGTNSTSATNPILGSAKAWVNFDGTGTVAIRGSYNVSSITDNGTGDYTVNLTNALSNANYSVVLSLLDVSTTNAANAIIKNGGTFTSSACQIVTGKYSTGNYDPSVVCVSIFSS